MLQPDSQSSHTSAVAESFYVNGRRYISRFADCGKENCKRCGGAGVRRASHGPYWYLCVTIDGRWVQIYLGKNLDTTRFVTAQGNIDTAAIAAWRRRPTTRKEFAVSEVPPPPKPPGLPAPATPTLEHTPAPAAPALEDIPAYDHEYAARLPAQSPPLSPDPADPGPLPRKSP